MGSAEVMGVAEQDRQPRAGKFADFLIVYPAIRRPARSRRHWHLRFRVRLRESEAGLRGRQAVAEGTTIVGQDEAKLRAEIDTLIRASAASAERRDKKTARPAAPLRHSALAARYSLPAMATVSPLCSLPSFRPALAVGSARADTSSSRTPLSHDEAGEPAPFTGYMTVGDQWSHHRRSSQQPPAASPPIRVIDAGAKFIARVSLSHTISVPSVPRRGHIGQPLRLDPHHRSTPEFITADDAYWFSRAGATECLRTDHHRLRLHRRPGRPGADGRGEVKRSRRPSQPGPFDDNQLKRNRRRIRFVNSVTLVESARRTKIVPGSINSSPTPGGVWRHPLFLKMAIQRPAAVHPHKERLARGAGHEKYGCSTRPISSRARSACRSSARS